MAKSNLGYSFICMNVLKNCRHGLMIYNKNDQYVGRSLNDYGEFSQEEVDVFEALLSPGMTVIDVGANIGTHTIAFARIVGSKGTVFAYEPQRMVYYTLCGNVAVNNLSNVYCLQNAIGNSEGRVDIPELDAHKSQNWGELQLGVHYPNAKSSCSVRLIKLDSLINLERVDFIKIDIEGMEPEALLGAKELITKHKPILYVESDRKENMTLLVKIIRGLGYDIHFHSPLLYSPNNYDRNDNNVFNNLCSINMLCTPVEKPMTLDLEKYRLTVLRSDGKVMLQTTRENIKQVYDTAIKDVTTSCMKAAHYYSDKLYLHSAALAFTEFALRTNPHDVESYHYGAQVFCRMFNYEEALKLLDAALEEAEDGGVMFTRAAVLGGLGRFDEAIKQYKELLEIDPKNPNTHFNLACSLITVGQMAEGWKEYEWRFKIPSVKQFLKVLPDVPLWDGKSSLEGKRILLFTEQGYGDIINFIHYLKHTKGAHVTLACQRGLVRLLEGYNGINRVVAFNSDDGSSLVAADYDCMFSLLSLPSVFPAIESGDCLVPKKDGWKAPCRFAKKDFKVGICWAGNDMHENDHGRSCYLKEFEAISNIPNVKLYSLQKGDSRRVWITDGPTNLMKDSEKVKFADHTSTFGDLNDTANYIQNLDLVITVDTSIAHLAAALGKPTWILLGFYSDQRWFLDRSDSPWYPSVRLFRQPLGKVDWPKVFGEVKEALVELLEK